MANEATINSGFQISKTSVNLHYKSAVDAFRATVTGSKGPTPGSVLASYLGTNIDLSELDSPGGFARIVNKALTGFVVLGIFDGFEFYPFMDLLPGEAFTIRLSRFIGQSIGTGDVGTGTFDTTNYRLRAKSIGVAQSEIIVEAFDL